MSAITLLDTVTVVADRPDLGLSAGEIGAVVEILAEGTAFEVEFVDAEGHSLQGLHTLRAEELVALHTRGRPLRAATLAGA